MINFHSLLNIFYVTQYGIQKFRHNAKKLPNNRSLISLYKVFFKTKGLTEIEVASFESLKSGVFVEGTLYVMPSPKPYK